MARAARPRVCLIAQDSTFKRLGSEDGNEDGAALGLCGHVDGTGPTDNAGSSGGEMRGETDL